MERKTFWQFSAPSNILMVTLMIFPLVIAIWLGFHFITFRNINSPEFVGLRNYQDVLTDPRFWQSMRFTMVFIAITVPAQMVIGLVVALLLDQISTRIRGLYLAAMLLPFIVVPVVGTLMFKQLFEPSGLIAWFFRAVIGQRFIFTATSVKTLIILHAIWYVTPFAIITFFAGLQTLSKDLVEASLIDGANRWHQIRYIVIPHLQSLIVLVALISIMDAYRIFDSVFVLTEQNPIFKASTVMVYNFEVALTVQRLGKANAMAVLTIIGILIVLIPFLYRTYQEQIEER
jgi:ABC-type sugar transport system permease subunit